MAETKRNKEFVVGDVINKLDTTVEKVRDLAKDLYNAKPEEDQIRDKDIYIRAILGSKMLIERVYKYYSGLYHGRFSPGHRCFIQLVNEIQFLDWLQNKLNDIYIAEYQNNVKLFGDAKSLDMDKPETHRGRRTKAEQALVEKWNRLHPEDPILTAYEQRHKKKR